MGLIFSLADGLENLLGKPWIELPLVDQIQHTVAEGDLLGFAEGVFFEHVIFPKPVGNLAPQPERRFLGIV
jgi:hypothetical protein